jgi:hypothetical protein
LFFFCSKIIPTFFSIKEGSTSHLGLLSSGEKKETALLGARNRYALRLADHQRSSPYCAGWDRLVAMHSIPSLKPIYMNQQKEKTSYIYYCLLINFAANSKKSATFLKLSNCWQYILAQGSGNLVRISTFIILAKTSFV